MGFDVPDGWRRVRLGEIADRGAQTFDPLANGARRYVSLEHITPNRRTISSFGDSSDTKSTKTIFERSDVLFGRLRPYLRKVALPQKAGVCSTDILALRPKKSVESEFLYAVMADESTIQFAINNSRGTRMPRTSWKALSKFPILLPPRPEQKKIAAILSSVDEAIEAMEAVIEQTRQVKKGLLQELLTRGIGHTEFKKTEIGEIPKSWGIDQVGNVLSLRNGKSKSIRNLEKHATEESPIPVYGGNGIAGYSNDILVDVPTVVIGRVGEYCGSVHLTTQPVWVSDNAIYVDEVSSGIHIAFLAEALVGARVSNLRKKTGQPLITQDAINSISIPIPPVAEQIGIVGRLRQVELVHTSNEIQSTQLKNLKKGLLQDLLTGKVRVDGAGVSGLVEAGV